jgi:hypothetical protein
MNIHKYEIYLVHVMCPIFVWATEINHNYNYYRFMVNGNYSVSFPRSLVKRIEEICINENE